MIHIPSVQNCTLPPPVRHTDMGMITADCPGCGTKYLLVQGTRREDDTVPEFWANAEQYWAKDKRSTPQPIIDYGPRTYPPGEIQLDVGQFFPRHSEDT